MYRHERVFYLLSGILMLAIAYYLGMRIQITKAIGAWGLVGNLTIYGLLMLHLACAKNRWLQKWRETDPHARRSILLW